MSRELSADFQELVEFIKKYNLDNIANDKKILPIISMFHKKYYALLALLMELNSKDLRNNRFLGDDNCKNYLFESLSDLGNSLFLAINGGYKASKLMMRSSIETFIKGISVDSIPNIVTEKRVSLVFENASNLSFLSSEHIQPCFNEMRIIYSELCKDTHTANIKNMQLISSLNYFPTQDLNKIKNIANIFISLTQIYIFIISMKFNNEFHQIHHLNKSNIIRSIKKSKRPAVLNLI